MKTTKEQQQESIDYLRNILKPGDTVSVITRHTSRSGMRRRLSLFVCANGEVTDITWHIARVNGDSVKQGGAYVQDAGLVANGCGMDMHFAEVYNLGRILFPDGFKVEGRGRNGDTSGWDNDGGYALNKRSM